MRQSAVSIISGLLFLALWGGLWVYARSSPLAGRSGDISYDPLFFPNLLMGAGAILSAILVLQGFARNSAEQPTSTEPPQNGRLVLAICIFIGLYFAGMAMFGFVLPSIVFLIVLPVLLGYRTWPVLVVLAPTVTAVTWFVFTQWLKAPLPPFPWS